MALPLASPATPKDFDQQYLQHRFVAPPRLNNRQYDLERIRSARDAQLCGRYSISAPLAMAMRTDPAYYAALLNRVAPSRGLPREMQGEQEEIRAEAEQSFGEGSDAWTPGALANLHAILAEHGQAVLQNIWTPRADGTRIDNRLEPWPMSCVNYNSHKRILQAQTTEGLVDIQHGDGKWVVAQLGELNPWQDGAIVALALTWADRVFGTRDRAQHAEAHGLAKPVAKLPEGIAIDSPEGKAVEALLQRFYENRSGGVVSDGVEVKYVESTSQAWQIFREVITSDDRDIFRALLGTEGVVRDAGGNYTKSHLLFGVRNDLVEGDLRAAERALNSGTLLQWSLLNFAEKNSPRVHWLMPDADEDARRESIAARHKSFNEAVGAYKANGFLIDQPFVDTLAKQYGIKAPRLALAS